MIYSYNGEVNVYSGIDYDFSLSYQPKWDANGLFMGAKGLFFAESTGEVEPPIVPPYIP